MATPRGISEVFSSILLVLIGVSLSTALVVAYLNAVGMSAQQAAELARPCTARAVAVANQSGHAVVYVYNMGSSPCVFDRVYVYNGTALLAAAAVNATAVAPGAVRAVPTGMGYGDYLYRLAGPHVSISARP